MKCSVCGGKGVYKVGEEYFCLNCLYLNKHFLESKSKRERKLERLRQKGMI